MEINEIRRMAKQERKKFNWSRKRFRQYQTKTWWTKTKWTLNLIRFLSLEIIEIRNHWLIWFQ